MNIENPISTIKKAILGRAEKKAYEDNLDMPEQRHIDESLNFYKKMRVQRPDMMNELILMSAGGKNLREKMGLRLFKIFSTIWEEETGGFFYNLMAEGSEFMENYFKNNQNLPRSEFHTKMEELSQKILEEDAKEVRNNSSIALAFSGKEELLNEAIDYMISSTIFEVRNNYYFS